MHRTDLGSMHRALRAAFACGMAEFDHRVAQLLDLGFDPEVASRELRLAPDAQLEDIIEKLLQQPVPSAPSGSDGPTVITVDEAPPVARHVAGRPAGDSGVRGGETVMETTTAEAMQCTVCHCIGRISEGCKPFCSICLTPDSLIPFPEVDDAETAKVRKKRARLDKEAERPRQDRDDDDENDDEVRSW